MHIKNKQLPDKTVERLSQYRRALLQSLDGGKTNIFSHELANLIHVTAVQVRRDIMLIGYSGTLRKGYDIRELIELIGNIIDTESSQKVAVVGIGNLGRALISYFKGRRPKLNMVAAFDTNPEKVNRLYAGVACYPFDQLADVVKKEGITIGVITTPASETAQVADNMVQAGIRGILNYTPTPLHVSSNVYLEEYNMITSLEKVAYFVKENRHDTPPLL